MAKSSPPASRNRGRGEIASIPKVAVIERLGSDEDGLPLARPVKWPGSLPTPTLRLFEAGLDEPFPIGARALARLVPQESGAIEARILRVLGPPASRVVGVFYHGTGEGRIVSADRRNRTEYRVSKRDADGAEDGELVIAEQLSTTRLGAPRARIVERLGHSTEAGAISSLVIATYDIPTEFPPPAITEAEAARPPTLDGRADLRAIPLVTIDGEDARDFDDAVWAERDSDPDNPGGWHLVVAIADVAWYVRPDSALDREARRRGNSVYFPDRVVPMLPEALSNELCSLQPGVDRACLAVHLWIDAVGRKRRHRFERGLMRSAARLTYEEIQSARERRNAVTVSVPPDAIDALYGAYAALAKARAARGALELDIEDNKVVLDAERRPVAITRQVRLDSHRLIEEFMIMANVAAAEELEARRLPCLYRVHDAPEPEKLEELRVLLAEIGIPGLNLPKGLALKPELFNRILRRAASMPAAALIVNELVLRCQAQAAYSPHNIGHFGLALRRYAHFTSPIRRYADLVAHRRLTGDAATGEAHEQRAALAEHISLTERRAAAAERAATARYRSMLLAESIGAVFAGHITGVTPAGLFVMLAENGAVGLVPISTLPADYYDYDERTRRLIGRRSGRVFQTGDAVVARLVETDAIGGRVVLRLEENGGDMSSTGLNDSGHRVRRRSPARDRFRRR
jgi:ribonuclease R